MEPKHKKTTGPTLCEEWRTRIAQLLSPEDQPRFAVVQSTLQDLEPPNSLFDCIVSPANSYGLMDGGVDYYISEALSPKNDIMALTRTAQAAIKKRYYGLAPPGSCTLVPLPPLLRKNPRFPRCRVLAVCPTMRIPAEVDWHRDLVYNVMWSLLTELERWNERAAPEDRITKVAMTGLATGVGGLPKNVCAWQMILAIKHFLDVRSEAGRNRWAQDGYPGWNDVLPSATEVEHIPNDDAK
ncbi:hypothetical protein BKA93DRAFT_738343 [Sparassis latifolia]